MLRPMARAAPAAVRAFSREAGAAEADGGGMRVSPGAMRLLRFPPQCLRDPAGRSGPRAPDAGRRASSPRRPERAIGRLWRQNESLRRCRRRLRALTKPTTAKIALIYKKIRGDSCFLQVDLPSPSGSTNPVALGDKFCRRQNFLVSCTCILRSLTVYVSSLGCKYSFLVLRAFSTL